jgi:hypothetical protein
MVFISLSIMYPYHSQKKKGFLKRHHDHGHAENFGGMYVASTCHYASAKPHI